MVRLRERVCVAMWQASQGEVTGRERPVTESAGSKTHLELPRDKDFVGQ